MNTDFATLFGRYCLRSRKYYVLEGHTTNNNPDKTQTFVLTYLVNTVYTPVYHFDMLHIMTADRQTHTVALEEQV